MTWTTVIYYRGSVLITYLQYPTLASEIRFSLSIKIQKKRSIRNLKPEPQERDGEPTDGFQNSNKDIRLHAVPERKKFTQSGTSTAFSLS